MNGILKKYWINLSGCEVYLMDLINLDLPDGEYDGIFANATLFHTPRQEIVRVMSQLNNSLKHRGVLFCSNPRGNNEEGFNGERYGCYYDAISWNEICRQTGSAFGMSLWMKAGEFEIT